MGAGSSRDERVREALQAARDAEVPASERAAESARVWALAEERRGELMAAQQAIDASGQGSRADAELRVGHDGGAGVERHLDLRDDRDVTLGGVADQLPDLVLGVVPEAARSVAAAVAARARGASIFRVHDVAAARQALDVFEAIHSI